MSSTTYQMKSDYRCRSPSNQSLKDYDSQNENKEKDMLISQLKAHIFELEQHEKDYNALEDRFTQLQNAAALERQDKLRLECELKNKEDSYNKTLCSLQNDNENLQLNYNDKMTENKKLFCENDAIESEIEMKEHEICCLNEKLKELMNQLKNNENQNESLQKMYENLINIKNNQNIKIAKLIEDNTKLTKVCQNQDNSLKIAQSDKQQLLKQLDEKNFNIKNLNNKINELIKNETCLENNIKSKNNSNLELQANLKDYEKQFNLCQNENDNVKNNILKERSLRADVAKKHEQMENVLNSRENQLNKVNQDKENIKNLLNVANSQNNESQNLNEELKNHIDVLTVQNQGISNEIQGIIKDDEKMKGIMNRKERIVGTLRGNTSVVDKVKSGMLALSMGDYDGDRNCNGRALSPNSRVSYNSPTHCHYHIVDE